MVAARISFITESVVWNIHYRQRWSQLQIDYIEGVSWLVAARNCVITESVVWNIHYWQRWSELQIGYIEGVSRFILLSFIPLQHRQAIQSRFKTESVV